MKVTQWIDMPSSLIAVLHYILPQHNSIYTKTCTPPINNGVLIYATPNKNNYTTIKLHAPP